VVACSSEQQEALQQRVTNATSSGPVATNTRTLDISTADTEAAAARDALSEASSRHAAAQKLLESSRDAAEQARAAARDAEEASMKSADARLDAEKAVSDIDKDLMACRFVSACRDSDAKSPDVSNAVPFRSLCLCDREVFGWEGGLYF
jgi:hypothetical protein